MYISTPRPDRRGGGAAITCDLNKFTLTKLTVPIPSGVEVCWGLLKPNVTTGGISKIIVCSFYSPPNSKKNTLLIEHISTTYHSLKTIHKQSKFILGGDRNNLKIDKLLNISPTFKQHVSSTTHGTKILDIIVSDLLPYYDTPIIRAPLQPDVIGHGVASDHSVPVMYPHTDGSNPPKRIFQTKIVRPISESKIRELGQWITTESFDKVYEAINPNDKVLEFGIVMENNINKICPTKTIKISNLDKKWITDEIKNLCRLKKREYVKHGKSTRYKVLDQKYMTEKKKASKNFLSKEVRAMKESSPGQYYHEIKKMGSREGECDRPDFILPEHLELNLSPKESCEKIARFFSSISQEYQPVNINLLPNRVQEKLLIPDVMKNAPFIETYKVYNRIKSAKKTKSCVPGDIPPKILK